MLTQPTARNLPEIWMAFANAQTQACVDMLALTHETWMRCALTRNPLEYMSTASLMLPECASSAMRYCKSVSDIAQACRDLANGAAPHPAALPVSALAGEIGPASAAPSAPGSQANTGASRVQPQMPTGRPETSGSPAFRRDDAE